MNDVQDENVKLHEDNAQLLKQIAALESKVSQQNMVRSYIHMGAKSQCLYCSQISIFISHRRVILTN